MHLNGLRKPIFTKILFYQSLISPEMKELIEKVASVYEAFAKDAALQVENNNKAAGARARKASLELEKAMKEFRKLSIEASKK